MKKIFPFLCLIFSTSCSSQDKIVDSNPITASYETWVAGIRGGGSGINFYVDLKAAFSDEIQLKKVIFRGYETTFEKQDELHFIARIRTEANQQKFDGDTSKPNSSPKNNTKLAENEAILIFLKNGKEVQQLIKDIKEKPKLLYPSTKPKN